MTEAPAAERRRLPVAALGFAAAAALSSWNPLSAPFGLVVGLAALVLAARALARRARRGAAVVALLLALGAVVASGLVLALTAGVGRELGGMPIVRVPPRAEQNAELDRAAERTRAARDRARAELEALERPEREQEQASERKEPPAPAETRPEPPRR